MSQAVPVFTGVPASSRHQLPSVPGEGPTRGSQPRVHHRDRKQPMPPKQGPGLTRTLPCPAQTPPFTLSTCLSLPKFHAKQNQRQKPGSVRMKPTPGGEARGHETQSRKPQHLTNPNLQHQTPTVVGTQAASLTPHQHRDLSTWPFSPSSHPIPPPSTPHSPCLFRTPNLWVFHLPRWQPASAGLQHSSRTQRPARATSTLPHVVLEAPGAMARQRAPRPCRVPRAVPRSPGSRRVSFPTALSRPPPHAAGVGVEMKRAHLGPTGKPGLPPAPGFLLTEAGNS